MTTNIANFYKRSFLHVNELVGITVVPKMIIKRKLANKISKRIQNIAAQVARYPPAQLRSCGKPAWPSRSTASMEHTGSTAVRCVTFISLSKIGWTTIRWERSTAGLQRE